MIIFKKIIFIGLIILLFTSHSYSQASFKSVSFLIGVVEYGGPLGGGGWGNGVNYSFAGEYQLSEGISTFARVDYTILKYTQLIYSSPDINARNKIIFFTGEIKPSIWIFNILLGIGFSYQNVDEIKYDFFDPTDNKRKTHYIVEGEKNFRIHGLLGLGSEIKLNDEVDLLLQIRFLVRKEYTPGIFEVGLKYKL